MSLRHIPALCALALCLASCSDFLDRVPGDALSPATFWQTEADAQTAVRGCYRQLYSPYRPEEMWFWDTTSDNAFCYHRNKDYRSIAAGTMAPSGVPVHNYFTYNEIRACNEYLLREQQCAFASEATRARLRGEVRMIRAMSLFFRTMIYGDFPFSEQVYETVDEAMVERRPQAENIAFVKKEMEDIVGSHCLPDEAETGRITHGAALAFLTRVCLLTGDNARAASAAKQLIDTHRYAMPALTYEQSFLKAGEHNAEVILSFEHNQAGDFSMWVGEFFPNSYGGWSSIVPTQSLLAAYEMKNGLTTDEDPAYDPANPYVGRDPRLRATILYPGQTWDIYADAEKFPHGFPSVEKGSGEYWSDADNATHTGMNFKKFYAEPAEYPTIWKCERNFPIFRYAEVLLSYAEAKIELGEVDESVYDAINQVRRRAPMPDVDRARYASPGKLRELVRRVELAYEGLRRFDILRWGLAPEALSETIYHTDGTISDHINAEGDHDVCLQPYTDVEEVRQFTAGKHELLPVPQSAIDANPKLTQNPGY